MVLYSLPTSGYYHHLSCQPGGGDMTGVVLITTFHNHFILFTSQLITWCTNSEESVQHGAAVLLCLPSALSQLCADVLPLLPLPAVQWCGVTAVLVRYILEI